MGKWSAAGRDGAGRDCGGRDGGKGGGKDSDRGKGRSEGGRPEEGRPEGPAPVNSAVKPASTRGGGLLLSAKGNVAQLKVAGTPRGEACRYLRFGENWLRQLLRRRQLPVPLWPNMDLSHMDAEGGGPYALIAFGAPLSRPPYALLTTLTFLRQPRPTRLHSPARPHALIRARPPPAANPHTLSARPPAHSISRRTLQRDRRPH